MGLTDFFAMEAGEYLERLDTMVSGAVGPDRDELVRLARALRGSALMANQQPIGNVAAALESLARAVKEERVAWDERTRQTVTRAVDALKILVRSVATWGSAEDDRAKRIAVEISAAAGMPAEQPSPPSKPSVDTGTRAFVAREGATVAAVLNHTAKAIQRDGPSKNQFETVLRSMEPLRGLASLPELSPLPEFLDGVDQAIAKAAHGVDDPNHLALFLDVAARGLSKAAQEISTSGAAEADSAESREFTRRLESLLDIDGTVVRIQDLYYDDGGPHVLETGTPPAPSTQIKEAEFVAHGEHLCQVADRLERAQSDMQREIRTIELKVALQTLAAATAGFFGAAVSEFADAANHLLARGLPGHHQPELINALREIGTALGSVPHRGEQAVASELTRISGALRRTSQISDELSADTIATTPEGALSRPAAPSAAVKTAAAPPVPPLELEVAKEPAPAEEHTSSIAASWSAYEELRARLGDCEPSIEELIGATPASLQPTAVGVPDEARAPTVDETEAISITELCYAGTTALEEAYTVRDRIRRELAEPGWDAQQITGLIDELLDLVELGIGQP